MITLYKVSIRFLFFNITHNLEELNDLFIRHFIIIYKDKRVSKVINNENKFSILIILFSKFNKIHEIHYFTDEYRQLNE